jgi:PAS domain S-box-containing protein
MMDTNTLNPINTLIIEDQTDDLELVLFELDRQGIHLNWHRVDNEQDYLARLQPDLDLILADYHMPQFSALRALELLQMRGLEIPFIVITGSISEEVAVECMKRGAVDYLLKDRLSRLGPAIQQAMRERRLSLEKRRAEDALRDSEIKFKTLFTESLDVILIINSESGIVLDVNKTLQRVLGYAPHQLVGKHYSTLIPPLYEVQPSEDLIEAVRYHGAVFESRGFMRADGTICPMDITATVIPWGKGTAVVATLRDVSERARAQEAQQTAEVLKVQLEQEKELNELKSRFVSMVSHEYRTPLATIMTSSELLLHYGGRMTEENSLRHLTQIQQSVKNMLNLMNEVLTLEKMNLSQLRFEPKSLDFTEFCTTIVNELNFNTQGVTPIEFSVSGESRQVCVDESLLRQIIANLLSNAVKYSKAGSTVDFRLDWGSDRVMLTISDRGIGIPEEDQKRLFEPFHRARNVTGVSGTGLGLSIAKRAVELHGGTIGFQSQVGIGTTFVVIIPLTSESQCA